MDSPEERKPQLKSCPESVALAVDRPTLPTQQSLKVFEFTDGKNKLSGGKESSMSFRESHDS